MLTADLVTARRYKDELRVAPLDDKMRARAVEIARAYLDLAQAHVGRTRDELEEAHAAVEVAPREQRLAAGLRKLIEDRCEFDADEAVEPEALRREIFLRATASRRGLGDGASFDREGIVAEIAAARGMSIEALERALYADLRGAHVLRAVRPISPERLAAGYDLAQAQAVLLRAVRVVVEVECGRPGTYRALFRKLKFLRLLHTITPRPPDESRRRDRGGYRIEIDGPYSLFESVTRYGVQLAMALPAVAACDTWRLEASVRWGRERMPLVYRMDSKRLDSIAEAGETDIAATSHAAAAVDADANASTNATADANDEDAATHLSDEVTALLEALARLDTPWAAAPSEDILDLPGVGLCVPDLVLVHAATGVRVYVEVMGFWSREAVWRRVELVERGLPHRIVFAASRHLRVSEAALDDEAPAALYVYKRTINARALLDKVDAVAARVR